MPSNTWCAAKTNPPSICGRNENGGVGAKPRRLEMNRENDRSITREDREMSTKSVYSAIAAVSAAMASEGISKTRKNEQQGYRFRGIDEVMNALAPMLVAHGLLILPRMLGRIATSYPAKSGGTLFNVAVEAEFDFVSVEDGSVHVVKMFGEAMDSADKATNKAMSAAYKYAAFQAFCIPTEGDNDADAHHHEVAPERPAPKPKAKPVSSQLENAALKPASQLLVTKMQLERLASIAKKSNRAATEITPWLKAQYGVKNAAGLKQSQYDEVCAALEARGPLLMPGDGEE